MINFTFTGKLAPMQKSENVVPYDEHTYDSGWTRRQLLFFGINGSNRHRFNISGGYFPNISKPCIKVLGVATKNDDGTLNKGEMIEIPWKDRNLESNIEKVAEFRRLSIDLNEYGLRTRLSRFGQRVHEGESLTDEELKSVGIAEESQLEEVIQKAEKLHKTFISEWDFAECVNKMLNSGKFKDTIFTVRGTIECQYSDEKEQWYTNMRPQRIYVAKPGTEEQCVGSAVLFYSAGAVDSESLEEKEKYFVKAYTFEYDSARSKAYGKSTNIPCEFKLSIPKGIPDAKTGESDENDEKRAKALVKKFTVEDEDEVYEYGVRFDILNGSQKREVKIEDLDEDVREDLELGIISMDEIIADMGGSIYGERVTENVYKGVLTSNSDKASYTKGRKKTSYKPEDLFIPPLDKEPDEESESGNDDDLDW